jgi:hypothetical protein
MDAENRPEEQRNFDQWLDSALQARLSAEPRLGIEERVLARLVLQPQRTFDWRPLLAMASAAVLAIAIAIALLHPSQLQRTTNRSAQAITPATVDSASLNARSLPPRESIRKRPHAVPSVSKDRSCCGSTRLVARAQSEGHLPKLASFPMAHPETDEERMLAQLAAQLSAQQQFSDVARLSVGSPPKDLSIKELIIEPLETPTNSSPQD